MSFESIDGESIVLGLDLQGICLSTGSACSTGDLEPSHVLLAMRISPRDAQGSIRVSLGRSTEEADVDATVKALQATVERLRSISSVGGAATSR
jgi:cysteine desulfurase